MPRKNKEEYNQYMRDYARKKAQDKKGIKKISEPKDNDFNATDDPTPVLNLQSETAKEVLELSKTIFKDPDTGKPDKILTYIEQGAKYLPLAVKFMEGFMENMKAFNAKPVQAEEEEQKMQPPEGWESVSPLEKMKYKYSRPAWYEAGLAWDSYKESGVINPAVNINYVDKGYTPPRRGQIVHDQGAEPVSLNELSRKHPEPPLVDDQEKPTENLHDPKLEKVIEEKQKRLNTPKEIKDKDVEEVKPEKVEEDIVKELQEDNIKYVQTAINFVGSMDFEKFKKDIDSLDSIIKKYETFLFLMPVQLKVMLKQTSDEEILKLFLKSSAEKYNWCKENNKLEKITEVFNNLKAKL